MTRTLITTFPEGFDARDVSLMLAQAGSQVILCYPETTLAEDELIDLLQGVSGLIAGSEPLTKRVLEAATDLKIIARTGIGVDNIDLEVAHSRGIRVTITPGLTSAAVADLTMALLLGLARRICLSDSAVRHGRWERTMGLDLAGKVLGVIGLGAIGKLVVQRALAFQMRVVACDPVRDHEFARRCGISYLDSDEVLEVADFVSLHMPLTPQVRGYIGYRELRRMKRTAFLINTARGAIIDEAALCRALDEGWIAGAALDVFANEPPVGSHLLNSGNVILTPHIGAWTEGTWAAVARQAATEVVRALRGEPPLNPV